MLCRTNYFLLLGLLLLQSNYSFAATYAADQEIDRYLTDLQANDEAVVQNAVYRISASGLDESRLFDVVAERLNAVHSELSAAPTDKTIKAKLTHFMRALASSGDQRYRATFDKLKNESDIRYVRNRAKHSIAKLAWYAQRNAVMQDMENHVAGQSVWTTRFINLLTSPDPVMQRYGAEELHRFGSAEDATIKVIAAKLDAALAARNSEKIQMDLLAWYCRLLGTYAKQDYEPTLASIAGDRSLPGKVRRHARKALTL